MRKWALCGALLVTFSAGVLFGSKQCRISTMDLHGKL